MWPTAKYYITVYLGNRYIKYKTVIGLTENTITLKYLYFINYFIGGRIVSMYWQQIISTMPGPAKVMGASYWFLVKPLRNGLLLFLLICCFCIGHQYEKLYLNFYLLFSSLVH